jgi:hemolysin III
MHAADRLKEAAREIQPKLRGWLHLVTFPLSLVAGGVLIVLSPTDRDRIASAVFAITSSLLFGSSALFHRGHWGPRWHVVLRRLDHSTIFLLIAGTYTPFALLALHGALATAILIVVWSGALAGVALQLIWADAPRAVSAIVYIALGWVAVAAYPQMVDKVGVTGTALVTAGGILYSAGAVIYAMKRPDPVPRVFGYHEIFHALVITAAALHYAVVAFIVLPGAG